MFLNHVQYFDFILKNKICYLCSFFKIFEKYRISKFYFCKSGCSRSPSREADTVLSHILRFCASCVHATKNSHLTVEHWTWHVPKYSIPHSRRGEKNKTPGADRSLSNQSCNVNVSYFDVHISVTQADIHYR